MPIYRLYLLNPSDGRIEGFEEVSAADDAGAICLVNARHHAVPTELWIGSRKVIGLEPTSDRPAIGLPLPG